MKTAPHVLIVFQNRFPWEVRIDKFAKGFKKSGAEVTVLCRNTGAEKPEEIVDGVRIRRVGSGLPREWSLPVPGNPVWRLACRTAMSDFQPNFVIAREITVALPVLAEARRQRINVILDMAEHYPEAMRSWKKYSKGLGRLVVHQWKIPDRIERAVVPRCAGIVVVCEEQKERLMQEYAYPEQQIEVVLNTPELETWEGFHKGSRLAEPYRFGYHGVLSDDRNLETVIRGFDLAAEKDPKITLTISGGGEVETDLRTLASSMKNALRIKFTGRYKPETLPSLYDSIDFGIVSLRVNGFTQHTLANKFFDYAACGKPYIHTDLLPLNRMMASMKCGVSFRGGDPESVAHAMLELKNADYHQMSENGVIAVEKKFNWGVDEKKLFDFCKRQSQL